MCNNLKIKANTNFLLEYLKEKFLTASLETCI